MKKRFVLGFVVVSLFIGCAKDQNDIINVHREKMAEPAESLEPLYLSDEELIVYLQNDENDYFDKIDLLLSNGVLSDFVLSKLIENDLVSNNDLELILIVNSPLSDLLMNKLRFYRNDFVEENLLLAQTKAANDVSFIITGPLTNPKVIFSEALSREETEACISECNSTITAGEDYMIIPWGNQPGETPNFLAKKPCGDGNKRWWCGTLQDQEVDPIGGGVVIISSLCTNSEEYCQRRKQNMK